MTYLDVLGRCVYEDELLAQRVLDVISNHDPSTPLFLFWAMHVVGPPMIAKCRDSLSDALCSLQCEQVHGPLEVPQAYVDKFAHINDKTRQLYTAMVNFADDKVSDLQSHSYSFDVAI